MICSTGKRQYKTVCEAQAENRVNGTKKHQWGDVYRCNVCNDYHITSRGKKIKMSLY